MNKRNNHSKQELFKPTLKQKRDWKKVKCGVRCGNYCCLACFVNFFVKTLNVDGSSKVSQVLRLHLRLFQKTENTLSKKVPSVENRTFFNSGAFVCFPHFL